MKEYVIKHKHDKYGLFVDDEDYKKISHIMWYPQKTLSTIYFCHRKYLGRDKGNDVYHTLYLHRFIMNAKDGDQIIFLNHNSMDYRKINLRNVTRSQSCMKSRKRTYHKKKKCLSQYKGVSFNKNVEKWIAYICPGGKQIHLGYFDYEEDAAEEYNKKALELYGEYAHINQIVK